MEIGNCELDNIFICESEQIEDNQLLHLLCQWNMENIYHILRNASVGIEELRYLTEADLDKIFPSVESVGIKAKLREKIKFWKKQNFGIDEETTVSETPNSQEIDIEHVLKIYPRGKDCLVDYAKNKTVTPYHQQSIANCIIDYFIAAGRKLSLKDLEKTAARICNYFPAEHSATYFGRRGDSRKPYGKLYDRYYNYRKGNKILSNSNINANDTSVNPDTELDEILGNQNQTWLKYNDCPLEDVVDRWKATNLYRKLKLKKSLEKGETISAFISEWPLYKHCVLGPQLISCDFDVLFGEKGTNLLTKWHDFVPLIHTYYTANIKDKVSREIFTNLENENINADSRDYISALLLNAVITPAARYKNGTSIRKVTIQEGMDSFLVYINSAANLEEKVAEIRHRFSQNNITLQPIIIATGPSINSLDTFFVYIDGTKLKLSSFLTALDLCFKVFHVFDVQYPLYCKGVWFFIQKFFFEIETNHDEHQPKVNGLISHLNSLLTLQRH